MESLLLRSFKNAVEHWYIPLLVGVLFVIVSIVAFTSPMGSFVALSIFFSLSFLFGGLSEVGFAVANRKHLDNWGWSLAFGILTFVVGILLFLNPGLSMATLAFYIGFVVLFRSIAAIGFAMDIRKYTSEGWGLLLTLGILGAIISFILIWNPLFAGMSIVILIALSFLFAGLFSIALAFQMKRMHKTSKNISAELQKRVEALEADIRSEWGTRS